MSIEPVEVLYQSEQLLLTVCTKEHWEKTHFDEPWLFGWEFEEHMFNFNAIGYELSIRRKPSNP